MNVVSLPKRNSKKKQTYRLAQLLLFTICRKFIHKKVKKETFLKRFGDKGSPFYWKITVDCEDGNAMVYFGDITYEIKLDY